MAQDNSKIKMMKSNDIQLNFDKDKIGSIFNQNLLITYIANVCKVLLFRN